MSRKFPSFSQWKQLFKILKGAERKLFLIFFVLAFFSATYLAVDFYMKNTKIAPGYGGTYVEGVIGQPRFINPIYGETNDTDRTLIDLVYSGLMTYDKDGKVIPDLIQSYQVSEDGKTYTFILKDNLKWQDGLPLTADDVIYTIKTIQNSDYKSPLRADWLNVDTQKISDKSFSFALNSPYNSFLENCTVKIIPLHIWKNVLPESFALSSYNLQPIGSGPYAFSSLQQLSTGFIKSLSLKVNHIYYGKTPFISNIVFNFFTNKEDLSKSANQRTIDGFSITAFDNNPILVEKNIQQGWIVNEKYNAYSFSMPRYFAVFLNPQEESPLSDSNVVQALNYSTDKQELAKVIAQKFQEKNSVVDSPILPEYYGFAKPKNVYALDLEAAKKLLDKSGYKDDGTGQRVKINTKKPAFQFKSYLSSKSTAKTEITELQGCLARLDPAFKAFLTEETIGKYGTGTEKAVEAFQEKYIPEIPSTSEVGTATRKKLNELCLAPQNDSIPLKFTITTIDQPQIVEAANILKTQWQKVGVTIEIKALDLSELKEVIKTRSFEALIYGEALESEPDLYPFWHSTQANDPGLNLTEYKNKKADQLLKEAREALDSETKKSKLESLQDVILTDSTVIFLYNPDYIYWVSEKVNSIDTIKIIDPAKRFSNVVNWYINTRRIWK